MCAGYINKRILYAVVLCLFFCGGLYGMQSDRDADISNLLEKAEKYNMRQSYDSAVIIYDSALHLADENGNRILQAHIYRLRGRVFAKSNQYEQAVFSLQKAIELSIKTRNDSILAMAYLNLGSVVNHQGHPDSALELYMRCREIYENSGDSIGLGKINNQLSIHYKNTGDFDRGLKCALTSEYIFRQKNMQAPHGRALLNLGSVYERLGEIDTALACFELAHLVGVEISNQNLSLNALNNKAVIYWHQGKILMDQADSSGARVYYQLAKDEFIRAIDLSRENGKRKTEAMLYSNLSIMDRNLGQYDQSIESAEKSLDISRRLHFLTEQHAALNNLGVSYKTIKQYDKAETAYLESLEIALQSKQKNAIKTTALNLMNLYELTGQYRKALEYARLGSAYNDSIFNESKQREIEKHKTNFEILHLKDQNQITYLKKEKIRKERNLTYGISAAVIVILSLLLFYLRMRARKNRIIAAQKIQKLEDEKKIMNAQSIMVGQEKERERIAQELHDGIGVLLSTASVQFSSVEAYADDETGQMLKKANKLLKEAGKEVREISHNMMPGVLSKFGLKEAIEDLFDDVAESAKIKIDLRLTCGDVRLSDNMEIMLYRVIQEMLNNTLKHAAASIIKLVISRDNDVIFIDYSDNGKGFDREKLTGKGLGLSGIRSRIEYLGGKVELKSDPGQGTEYSCLVPVSYSPK